MSLIYKLIYNSINFSGNLVDLKIPNKNLTMTDTLSSSTKLTKINVTNLSKSSIIDLLKSNYGKSNQISSLRQQNISLNNSVNSINKSTIYIVYLNFFFSLILYL